MPPKMNQKSESSRKNYHSYCKYHRDFGHNTDNCFQLKKEIERQIAQGKLTQFLRSAEGGGKKENSPNRGNYRQDNRQQTRSNKPYQRNEDRQDVRTNRRDQRSQTHQVEKDSGDEDEETLVIQVISGGPAAGGTSCKDRKHYKAQNNKLISLTDLSREQRLKITQKI